MMLFVPLLYSWSLKIDTSVLPKISIQSAQKHLTLKCVTSFKPWLQERFFQSLSYCQRVTKTASVETLKMPIFFRRLFQLSCQQFKGGYTCDFHCALATRKNLKKFITGASKKIACVAVALGVRYFRVAQRNFFEISAEKSHFFPQNFGKISREQ